MGLEQKCRVVQQLKRDFSIKAQYGAIDIDFLSCTKRNMHPSPHFRPSRMIVQISLRPRRFLDCPQRIRAASLTTQSPTEIRSALSASGRSFSGSTRSLMKMFHRRLTKSRAAAAVGEGRPVDSALQRSEMACSKAARSRSRHSLGLLVRCSAYEM